MKFAKSLVVISGVALALSACAPSKDNSQGGACGEHVVEDYNKMVYVPCHELPAAPASTSSKDIDRYVKHSQYCTGYIRQFLNVYPTIDCSGKTQGGSDVNINHAALSNTVKNLELKEAIYRLSKDSKK